jgi:hypothetical protein
VKEGNVGRASSMHKDMGKVRVHLEDEGMGGRIMLMDKLDHRK